MEQQPAQINVWAACDAVREEAPAASDGLLLRIDGDGLSLVDGELTMRGDFATAKMRSRIRAGALSQELLVRAAKIKNPDHRALSAIDATAGMGEDSFLLAAAGFSVRLYETDPVIAALLRDALRRAAETPDLAPIASRMELLEGDSVQAMRALSSPPDLILLDPMFPERRKSALIKKKFQLLHQLERPCENEEELFAAAVAARPHKLVIKRPVKGPVLAGHKPDYAISGKAVRYDCFVFP
jgi:16S rRNA (guanine1516-N2)-methyltransferase